MIPRFPREFDFMTEVLPTLTIGILLNLVGRYTADQLESIFLIRILFLDLAGAAYVALLLGPWWAATAAILSSLINSHFYFNYFPFAVTNVICSLVWGYYANLTLMRIKLTMNPSVVTVARLGTGYALLGGIISGISSFLIKLALYPPMGRPLTFGETYQMLLGLFGWREGDIFTDRLILLIGDVLREGLDKLGASIVGIFLVLLIRVLPIDERAQMGKGVAFKTEPLAIGSFALAYGVFLLGARLLQPELAFRGAAHPVEWMQYPSMIAIFYIPLAIALMAFLLLSFDLEDPAARTLDAARLRRRFIYTGMAQRESLSDLSSQLPSMMRIGTLQPVFGLLGSFAAWPAISSNAPSNLLSIAFFSITALVVLSYIVLNRRLVGRFAIADDLLSGAREWLDIKKSGSAAPVLGSVADVLTNAFELSRGKVLRSVGLSYVVFLGGEPLGRSRSIAPNELDNRAAGSGILAAVSDHEAADGALEELNRLAARPDIGHIYLLDRQGPAPDKNASPVITVFNPHDVAELAFTGGERKRVVRWLEHVRLRALESRTGGDAVSATPVDALCSRSLPHLARLIDGLRAGSLVIDLGAGRGRHSLYALRAGHSVVAVDRRADAIGDLHSFAQEGGAHSGRLRAIVADFASEPLNEYENADLVIATGVLQHSKSAAELEDKLRLMSRLASAPGGAVFIEMLLEMKFDGQPPTDGRLSISQTQFENLLAFAFAGNQSILRVAGPTYQKQDYADGPRSFFAPAKLIESVSVQYLIRRDA